MKNRSDASDPLDVLQKKLAGFGEYSLRKTYYPELQQSLEDLRESEAFLKNIVDNIPAMVFVKDAIELRYVALNKAGEDLLGYSREELLGKNDRDLFPEEQAAFFSGKDREVLARGDLLEIPEETVKTRSGDDRILRVRKIPLFDVEGKARYLLGIAEDITDRKRLEEQLLQSQKMEAIGQLAGGVAHDFNNILMVIMGYGNMLKMDLGLESPQKEKLEHIIRASERAAQLTRSLLTFSRKQVMNPQSADLNDVVNQVRQFLERIIGEDIHLKTALASEKLAVVVDSGQIEQVLVNLATNARDAMPKGGVLTLETGATDVDESFIQANGFGKPGRYALISVSDTGTGMDEKTRLKIFEPFFTTKEVGRGTGLGMAIVYGIVKQHHGFVNVYSEPGIGTTFRIYLPINTGEFVGSGESVAPEPPKGGSESILVAEDDAGVRKLVLEVLTGFGYTVLLAENGLEAVEVFRANRDSIKLILMDIIMPRMNGKEAYREIRLIDPDVKIVYTSGYTLDTIQSRDVIDEGAELVMKPIQPLELLRKVRELLDSQ
ncbi:MAG: PAS domain-containing protein [Geobacteraceae bacterium]|nr:PAS domain-containing protein [Geobacteraceae bacterium]